MRSFQSMIQGFVRIRVKGYGATRFVNICKKRGFHIHDLVQGDEEYELNISVPDFKQIRDVVHKTNVKVAIVEKHGLPFFFLRMSARKCFVLGALICFGWLLFMSRFIWAIEIEGNVSISDEMILDYLETQNIKMGTTKSEIDTDALEKSFRKDFGDITWVSIGQEGTTLSIDVKERDVVVYEEEGYSASSLYAPRDGTVVSVVVRSGEAKVKAGDVVTKGQLIIDGVLPVVKTDGTILDYRLVNADADVLIAYSENYQDELSFYRDEKQYSGETYQEYSLRLGNKMYAFHWFYPQYEKEEISESFYQLKLWEHFYLPVWFYQKTHKEYDFVRVKKDKSALEAQLYENLSLFLKSLEEKGVQNMQKDVKIGTSGSMLTLSGELYFVDSNLLREEINPATRTELLDGQYNSVNNGDEH